MKKGLDFYLWMALIAGVAFIIGTQMGFYNQRLKMQIKAIENNCASYDRQTGNFEWIEDSEGRK